MVEFRRARIGDAEGIAKVLIANYRIEDEGEAIEVFKKEFVKGHNFMVALDEGRIVGVASWSRHGLPRHRLAWMNRFAALSDTPFEIKEELFSRVVQEIEQTYKETNQKLRKIFVFCHESNKE